MAQVPYQKPRTLPATPNYGTRVRSGRLAVEWEAVCAAYSRTRVMAILCTLPAKKISNLTHQSHPSLRTCTNRFNNRLLLPRESNHSPVAETRVLDRYRRQTKPCLLIRLQPVHKTLILEQIRSKSKAILRATSEGAIHISVTRCRLQRNST